MAGATPEHKTIARAAAAAFGGAPTVARYWDENEESSIALLCSEGRPREGLVSYATIGLSDIQSAETGDGELGFEIAGFSSSAFPEFANCLATAAFCVINSKWKLNPGSMFPDVVAMYRKRLMKHMLFVSSASWEDTPTAIQLGHKTVEWLVGVPISHDEMRYADEHGTKALEEMLKREGVDLLDMDRASIV